MDMLGTDEIMTAHEKVNRRINEIVERNRLIAKRLAEANHFFARNDYFSRIVVRFPSSVRDKMKWEGFVIGSALQNVYGSAI